MAASHLTEKVKLIDLHADDKKALNLLRPLRTTEGSLCEGNRINLVVNHFHVNIKKKVKLIFHYDVTITQADQSPNEVKKNKKKEIGSNANQLPDRLLPLIWIEFQKVYEKENKRKVAMPFDGKKNCYTVEKLNLGGQVERHWQITMKDPDDDDKIRTFDIRLKFTNDICTSKFVDFMNSRNTKQRVELPQDVIQAFDVALRSSPSNNFFCCNRSFFSNVDPFKLDDYLDLFYGHYQSLTPGSDIHPTLNIDLANKAFVRRVPLTTMLCQLFKSSVKELDQQFWNEEKFTLATDLLAGKLIEYGTGHKDPITGRYEKYHKFPAIQFLKHTSNTFEFTNLAGGKVNIAKYFLKEKNTKIERPNIPVLHIGSKSKTNYVPVELCTVTEQPYKGKMEPSLTSAMIKGAAKAPKERFQRIQTARAGCKFNKCNVLDAFGLSVAELPIIINNARHLNPPMIKTKQSVDTVPENKTGSWSIKNKGFYKAANVPVCAILDTVGSWKQKPTAAVKFFQALSKEAQGLGLVLKPTHHYVNTETRCPNPSGLSNKEAVRRFTKEVDEKLQKLKESKYLLVFVIISDDGREYPIVKSSAEVKIGVLTSCLKQKTLFGNAQTMGNFLLKLNAKLGGENFQLSRTVLNNFFKDPVLVMGADVTHPAPNSTAPSFAAVTASIGMSGMNFAMHIQAQASKQEIICNLRTTTKEMLLKFRNCTNKSPQKILMFRDGVSEGYFDAIKESEYMAIKNACNDLNVNYNPKITFVVVKKRHHTRFCPKDSHQGVGKPMNVPPGTVVDKIITHPVEQEFFLNSHVGIQGTSKPTRYHVIHDDSLFTMDQIQQLSYYLCYMYVRCCQPVSYPAPTYYAHLAAFRARTLVSQEGDSADLNALAQKLTIHPDLQSKFPMFFV